MSLFKKGKKNNGKTESKKSERNEINNKDIKEALGNTALSVLQAGKDYTELLNTTVEFGYDLR